MNLVGMIQFGFLFLLSFYWAYYLLLLFALNFLVAKTTYNIIASHTIDAYTNQYIHWLFQNKWNKWPLRFWYSHLAKWMPVLCWKQKTMQCALRNQLVCLMFVLDIDLFEIQPLANLSQRLRLRCVNAIFDVYFLFHWHKCNMYRVHTHNFLKFAHGKTVKIWNVWIFREIIRFNRQTRRTVLIEIIVDFTVELSTLK